MACRMMDDETTPATHALDRFNELGRVLEQELLMDRHGLDDGEAAVLAAMGAMERSIAPLRPFGLAGDTAIANEARLGLYRVRRSLASLRNRGLVGSCFGGLRWSLTDEGRARIATNQETTP